MNTGNAEMNPEEPKGIAGSQRQPDDRMQQYLKYAMVWAQDAGMTLAEFFQTELGRHPEFEAFISRSWNLV